MKSLHNIAFNLAVPFFAIYGLLLGHEWAANIYTFACIFIGVVCIGWFLCGKEGQIKVLEASKSHQIGKFHYEFSILIDLGCLLISAATGSYWLAASMLLSIYFSVSIRSLRKELNSK